MSLPAGGCDRGVCSSIADVPSPRTRRHTWRATANGATWRRAGCVRSRRAPRGCRPGCGGGWARLGPRRGGGRGDGLVADPRVIVARGGASWRPRACARGRRAERHGGAVYVLVGGRAGPRALVGRRELDPGAAGLEQAQQAVERAVIERHRGHEAADVVDHEVGRAGAAAWSRARAARGRSSCNCTCQPKGCTRAAISSRSSLITGAAGGIGEATARVCASLGAEVLLVDRRRAEPLAQQLRQGGAEAAALLAT